MDLRKGYPRSMRVKMESYVHLARMIDKCRAVLVGTEGEYIYPTRNWGHRNWGQVTEIGVRSCNHTSSLIGTLSATRALPAHCGYRARNLRHPFLARRLVWSSLRTTFSPAPPSDCFAIDFPRHALCPGKGLQRPHVARAQETIRLPLPSF